MQLRKKMSTPNLAKAKRGEVLEIISPSDGAVIQVAADLSVKVVGFDEVEAQVEAEESQYTDLTRGSDGATADDTGSVDDDPAPAESSEELNKEETLLEMIFGKAGGSE